MRQRRRDAQPSGRGCHSASSLGCCRRYRCIVLVPPVSATFLHQSSARTYKPGRVLLEVIGQEKLLRAGSADGLCQAEVNAVHQRDVHGQDLGMARWPGAEQLQEDRPTKGDISKHRASWALSLSGKTPAIASPYASGARAPRVGPREKFVSQHARRPVRDLHVPESASWRLSVQIGQPIIDVSRLGSRHSLNLAWSHTGCKATTCVPPTLVPLRYNSDPSR